MDRFIFRLFLAVFLPALGGVSAGAKTPSADWSLNATIIEACSCPVFCTCYFNPEPASHASHGGGHGEHGGMEHFCRLNNAFRVNKGHYGPVQLDGLKFWVGGDLGGDFRDGAMDWAVLTFDPGATPQQREEIARAVEAAI